MNVQTLLQTREEYVTVCLRTKYPELMFKAISRVLPDIRAGRALLGSLAYATHSRMPVLRYIRRPGKPGRPAAYAYYEKNLITVSQSRCITVHTLLHEYAHLLCPISGHGPEFCGHLDLLLVVWDRLQSDNKG